MTIPLPILYFARKMQKWLRPDLGAKAIAHAVPPNFGNRHSPGALSKRILLSVAPPCVTHGIITISIYRKSRFLSMFFSLSYCFFFGSMVY